jgi:hypothetical protein
MADGEIVTTLPAIAHNSPSNIYPGLEGFPHNAYLFPSLMSAHEEIEISRREAVRQARQAERRSETIRGGLDRKVNTLVGADLFPRLTPTGARLVCRSRKGPKWAAEYARHWRSAVQVVGDRPPENLRRRGASYVRRLDVAGDAQRGRAGWRDVRDHPL